MDSAEKIPWQKPWVASSGYHRNLLTGHEYQGANPLLLELGLMMRDSTLPLWAGSGQAKKEGWLPRKGSKAVRILRPQLNSVEVKDDDGKPKLDSNGDPEVSAWVSYKVVPVFNAADLTGTTPESESKLQARIKEALGPSTAEPNDQLRVHKAEGLIDQWPVPIKHGGAIACYSPTADKISMPLPEAFISRETYLATKLHEIMHSTGHKSRLDRKLGNSFGSKAYAKEELVAEFASVLACLRLDIGYEIENHASYLKSWAKNLREGGAKELLKVLSQAKQAADLVAPETLIQTND